MRTLLVRSSILALALLAFAAGCATSRVTFESSPPGAEVFAKKLGASEVKKLGVTPLTLTPADLEATFQGSVPLFIEYRMAQYNSTSTLVTDLNVGDLKITRELTPMSGLEDMANLNHVMDELFEAQRLAQISRYGEALKILDELQKETPQVSAIYEIRGAVFYLQKKFPEALDSYSAAARYNPRSPSAVRMRHVLENLLRVREPAKK